MYGEAIRKIRLKKGFSQKEVYGNVISKSYAIEFEKGKHQIAANILIQLLDNLSMDIDEFLFIANGYHLNEQNNYNYRYNRLANKQDIAGLQLLLEDLKKKSGKLNNIRIAEVRARIRILQNFKKNGFYTTDVVLEEDKRVISSYLTDVESWTLQEIQLFANTLEFLDNESIFIFFKKVSKLLEYYVQLEKGREIYCVLLINLVEYTFKKQQYDYTEVLLTQLDLLSIDYRELFHRTVYKFFVALLAMKKADKEKEKAKAKATYMLQVMKDLDHAPLAEMYSLLLV
ncbi:helix-turn-helix domain-containing protein [Enterococcus gallinarum]|uniref:helix-turn-helix domain-containing protein n=1 Tax=Enterococcus gallinarum TaxID=1353 RepID=UPI0012E276DB|nr:Rgg/GadR/MutR family transcriptional regulator [Enterococcus gallinarum]MUO31890.1 Rgg/GadR/MutR family transcriptional regulator [Enterococcus gallinarum]